MEKPMLTARQEAFCRAYIEIGCGAEAYRRAYPRSQKWEAPAVHVAGSKMLANGKVQLRVTELRAHVHESAQRFHESAQPWSCPAGAALEVAAHTAPRGGVRGRRLTLVAF